MKKTFRNTLAVLALAVLAIAYAPNVNAQININLLDLTGIGTVAGGATTTVTNQVMDVTKSQVVALYAKFNMSDTTTSNVVYIVQRSIDGASWETHEPFTWTIPSVNTTDVLAVTNINVGACGWLKLKSIQNTHASIVCTNKVFGYAVKRNSP